MRLKIGTRPSKLALRQLDEIRSLLPDVTMEEVLIETRGDRDKGTPLTSRENTDFFTFEIEQALLSGKIDAAVHSAKDLEALSPEGVEIAAVTGSISPYDCFVSKGNLTMDALPEGAVVGTSSVRRAKAVMKQRSDVFVKDIRGNVDERLLKLDKGEYDAIVVAHAALIRLGEEKRIAEIFEKDIMEPHLLQGRLAVQVRSDREELLEMFKKIDGKKA